MKKIIKAFMLTGLMALSLASCASNEEASSTVKPTPTPSEEPTPTPSEEPTPTPTPEAPAVELDYTIEVVDLDGTTLGKKSITTKDEKSLFEDLKANFDVKYSESEWGPYITSINSSIVDPNYGLMLYQNGTMSSVGVKDLVLKGNDEIKFVNECWNTALDETDKKIDKMIYKFLKNDKELFKDMLQDDFYLTAAMLKMKELNYNVDFDFYTEAQKEEIKNTSLADIKDTYLFKQANMLRAIGADLTAIKNEVSTRDIAASASPWSTPYILAAARTLDVELKNQAAFDEKLTAYVKNLDNRFEIGDSFGTSSHMIVGNSELTEARLNKLLNEQKKYFTDKGVYIQMYNNDPCVTTACVIVGFSTLGVDIRDDKWAAPNGKDLVEILLDYAVDGYYFKASEGDNTFKAITTPQCMAALMNYKMSRDLGTAEAPFKAVDTFA